MSVSSNLLSLPSGRNRLTANLTGRQMTAKMKNRTNGRKAIAQNVVVIALLPVVSELQQL
jgi:hypothetical protein